MLRRPRYAPAVVFALLALAFVGLWVRSYWHYDSIGGPVGENRYLGFYSSGSIANVDFLHTTDAVSEMKTWRAESVEFGLRSSGSRLRDGLLGIQVKTTPGNLNLALPYWFLAASSLGLAALLAFKPITRFTIRGLLITTTLLAAVLGLAVYAI